MKEERHYTYMEDDDVSGWTKFRLAASIISAFAALVSMLALIACAAMLAYGYCYSGRSPDFTLLIVVSSIFACSFLTSWAMLRSLMKECFKDFNRARNCHIFKKAQGANR